MNVFERPFFHRVVGEKSRSSVTCLIFAGFIAGMVYIFALTGGSFKQLLIVQGAFTLWIVFSITFSQGRMIILTRSIFILLVLAVVLSSNLIVNHGSYDGINQSFSFALAHVVGILVFVFAAQWSTKSLQPNFILECISWMLVPLIILALAVGLIDSEGSRAIPFGVHPNWWGETALGFILCSLALRKATVKILFITTGVGLMITVQSRGALLAAMVSLLVYLVVHYRPIGMVAFKKFLIIGGIVLGGLAFIMATGLGAAILDIVVSKILLLDNPYRGLDSGLTGRLSGWREAAEIFVENPIFGQGFDTLGDVHNGFLRWAGEGGVLLLGVMLSLIISAIVQSWRKHNDWALAALFGSMVYMMTYPRALNLNLVGMMFFFALFPWKDVRIKSGNAYLHDFQKL